MYHYFCRHCDLTMLLSSTTIEEKKDATKDFCANKTDWEDEKTPQEIYNNFIIFVVRIMINASIREVMFLSDI